MLFAFAPPSLRFRSRLPNPAGVALLVAISLGYGAEILFQPRVFENYSLASIAQEAASIISECLLAGGAMLLAVEAVERRASRVHWIYLLQLIAAVVLAATFGVLLWAVASGQPLSNETAVFLGGEVLRLTGLGAFLAITHGLGRRIRQTRSREREIELEAAALRADTELAQLCLLEAQIEPHFLFNTIANLRRTWHLEHGFGMHMHDNAIRYLEASLPRMRTPMATLRDELDLTRAYLELLSPRMGERLRFSIDVAPACGDLPFPRMSVLTLVENSIKHGLAPSVSGGTVAIRAETDAESLVLFVVDDGVGFGVADTAGHGIGLLNIRSRLQAQYGSAARLEIASPDSGGVVASIRVPRPQGEPR